MAKEDSFFAVVEAFLDSCDLETLSSASDSPLSGARLVSDKPRITSVRHKVYRKRRRVEREQLELEIEELKIKLAKEPRRLLSMSGWRMVAMCQLEARLVAELRHRQLRSAVSAQAALIQVYQGLTLGPLGPTSQHNVKIVNDCCMNYYYHPEKLQVESFDIEFYKTSAKTFNAVYALTDEVFASCGIDSTDDHYGSYTHEQKDENGKNYVQFTDKRKILSSFEHTCRTLKRTLSLHQQQDQLLYEGMEGASGTVAFKFRVTTRLKNGAVASSLMRVINRWYQEEKRLVVVWRVFAEGEGAFTGMHADEIGWEIISLIPGEPGNTLLRLCANCVPMNFSSVVTCDQEQAAERFSGMLVDTSTKNADEIACTLEKMVLEDAIE